MSTTVPQREAGLNSPHAVSGTDQNQSEVSSKPDILVDDEELRKQLETLARDNEQLLAALGLKAAPGDVPPATDQVSIEEENRLLRARIADLEKQLAGDKPAGDAWSEQQKEYEALLEEKSEVIRALHQKIQELREGRASGSGHTTPSAEDPQQRSELEELRAQLEAERDQLRQDEESLMQQMTQMEMTMSRERAEMARQRNELQRLHSDIKHELEMASRDATLRERLVSFQRRHQEFSGRKGNAGSDAATPPTEAQEPTSVDAPLPKKGEGLLRRLFG